MKTVRNEFYESCHSAVRVESNQGTFINARALVDPCSEITLIANSLVRKVRSPSEKCSIQMFGVGDALSTTLGIFRFFIRSRVEKSCCNQVEAYILDDATSYSPKYDPASFDLSHLKVI